MKRPNLTLAVIALSYLLLVVDLSIAVTALPLIKASLGFSATSLSWIQNAYTLVYGGLLLLGARLGDIFGRRKMFILGLGLFGGASLVVGLASSATMMIIARVLQGVAAAVLGPSSLALLSTSFPAQPARGRALAIYGSITGIGTSLGLVLGGWIAGAFDWRWAFLVNIPLAGILMLLAKGNLQETEPKRGKIDYLGAIFSTLGMFGIVFALIRSAENGWSDYYVWLCLIVGLALMGAFIKTEQIASVALVPLRLFRSAQRTGANLARALFVGSMAAFWFFISQFLQIAKHMNPLETGLAFLPMTLASFTIAFFVPRLSRRFGDAPFLAGGLLVVTTGTIWLSFISPNGPYWLEVALPMFLVGIGQGASTIRLTSAGIAGVSAEDAGAASGIVSAHVQLGSALGLSVLISISATAGKGLTTAAAQIAQQANVAIFGGGCLCLLALIVVLIWVLPKRHQHADEV